MRICRRQDIQQAFADPGVLYQVQSAANNQQLLKIDENFDYRVFSTRSDKGQENAKVYPRGIFVSINISL